MTSFTRADDLSGAEFRDTPLRGARFVGADLTEAVMRGVEIDATEIDTPWLEYGRGLVVNGVDVVPFVLAELERRFPGRDQRKAVTPAALREAWARVEAAWAAAVARAEALPEGAVEQRVADEWSFAETLRHLVLATDLWLGHAVLHREQPFHPLGIANPEAADEGLDMSVFATERPTWTEVLEARASRQALVRDYLADVTDEELGTERRNPWSGGPETSRSCLHTILEEEWEHLRFATRDLEVVERGGH